MIRYTIDGSPELWADKIKVCYTPAAVIVMVLNGTKWLSFELSNADGNDTIRHFACDRFSLHA